MKTALVHFNHTEDGQRTTWPDMRSSSWYPNYGDMLVCAALVRQVQVPDTLRVGFGHPARAPVSRALIRGSTYLHRQFDFAGANLTLDSIDAPLAIVGLGAQSPEADVTILDDRPDARGFIARLNERSASISVRGAFSAAVVERLGGRDIRITGCPSLFHRLTCPQVTIDAGLATPERRIGLSLHTGLEQNIFCAAPAEARRAHVQSIRYGIDDCAGLSLFEQGVIDEFAIADRRMPMPLRRAAAADVLARLDAGGDVTPDELIAHMVSVTSIEEWLERARGLDAIIGFRFHGNMVALLQGKPCHYQLYDSRIREFCDLYALPFRDVRDPWVAPHRAMLDHDWDRSNAAMRACLVQMQAFYAENGYRSLIDDAA